MLAESRFWRRIADVREVAVDPDVLKTKAGFLGSDEDEEVGYFLGFF